MTSLHVLNLSDNILVGIIPTANQFQTFDNNSFRGNPNLCQIPLVRKCTSIPYIERVIAISHDENHSSIIDWGPLEHGIWISSYLRLSANLRV
ncbi:Receptor like protein 21 [Linum grandiflorum]